MQQATVTQRPWVTAGVTLTAASLVAVAPVVAPTVPANAFADIQLTGLVDETAVNITNLVDYFAGVAPANFPAGWNMLAGAPLPILQQVIENQLGYLGQVMADPGDIGTVFSTMFDNVGSGLAAPFGMFADSLATGGGLDFSVFGQSLGDFSRLEVFEFLSGLSNVAGLGGLFDFTASPVSGLMLGAVGPVLGPLVALGNGVSDAVGGNTGALLGIPEGMLNAFLNGGQALDATALLGLIGLDSTIDFGFADITLGTTGLELGGLLGGPGSLFNALTSSVEVDVFNSPVASVEFLGDGAGPLGSLISIPNSIAAAIDNSAVFDGLLPTLTTGLGLDQLSVGLNDIGAFLTDDILGPLTAALAFLPEQLANLLTGALGVDLGITALTDMTLDIPALLLAAML